MPDKNNQFHEFALKSILFKGQYDLYFCYIKAEKIAHVLSLLQNRSGAIDAEHMNALVAGASRLPETVAHFAAGEIELSVVLADLFSLLSAVRLSSTQNIVSNANALLIAAEYEALAARLTGGGRLSPFVTSEDFLLPPMPQDEVAQTRTLQSQNAPVLKKELHVKDIKGHNQGHTQSMNKRASAILAFVRKHSASSIKDISRVVKDCSEKTIQRELALLIEQGLIEKRGERRWSTYSAL